MIADDESREPRDEPVLGPRLDPDPTPEIGPENPSDTLAFEPVQRRRPARRIGRTLIILVLIAGVGAGAWARWGDQLRLASADEIPVVRADAAPFKVKPDRPGGLDIPNRDKLVYERLESLPPPPRAENLLPRPEAPLLLSNAAPAKTAEAKKPVPPPAPPAIKTEPKTVAAPPSAPPVIRTKPKAAAATPAKPAPPPAPPAIRTKSKTAAAPPARPVPPVIRTELKTAAAMPARPAPPPAPPAIKTKPKAAAAPPAKPVASTPKSAAPAAGPAGKGYRVQLAAVRSERDVQREWTRLRTRHSGLLDRLRLSVVRADLGDKGIYYRLRAGPLENKAAARTLCGKLTKIKVGCLVVRPGR